MERQIRRARQLNKRNLVISVASLVLAGLAVWRGSELASKMSQKLEEGGKNLTSQISTRLRVQEVVWEETGTTNSSHRVSRNLLAAMSEIEAGQEMLSIDLSALEKKILRIPWIESIQIQKKLPSTLLVRYTTHHVRALGLRKNRLWSISSTGNWIAPLESQHAFDLPVLVNESTLSEQLEWLGALENALKPKILQVHEVGFDKGKQNKLTALVEMTYSSQRVKIAVVAEGLPNDESLGRLRRVVHYLIKNNILVSKIDLRPGKKVVVNVGKGP
ncbi:MAG: FtsQ-type POTRA domain-containing protein [Bdellovibrionota bacterium]